MERLSYIDFEKGIRKIIEDKVESVRERNEKEFLEELDKAYENLREKYKRKYEREAQAEFTEGLLELGRSIHCYCDENIQRMENVVMIRIG